MYAHPRNPLVVVDWNLIQTASAADLRRGRLAAPACWDFLLPESAVHEVLDKGDGVRGSSAQHLRKLIGFCREFADRFWFGKSTGAICALPMSRPKKVADVVEIQATLATRHSLARGNHDFLQLVQRGHNSEEHHEFRRCENSFVELTTEGREFLKRFDKHFQPESLSDDQIRKWVRDPDSARQWLPKDFIRDRELTDAQVAQFPDIIAMGRWIRLYAWYQLHRYKMQLNTNKDKAFSNCFADADAAYLASYTGHLMTKDGGQQDAAIAIRPDVKIWEWDEKKRCVRRMAAKPYQIRSS